MAPLTREQLDPMGCSNPNCTHDHSVLFLNQACHPGRGVEVKYTKATGVATIVCHACKAPVADLAVAEKTAENTSRRRT